MIRVHNLSKYFGSFPAVVDVSFDVSRGEILGFLGPNGAGKTTTMKVLTCYVPATSGQVTTDGLDNFEHSLEVRRKIGYLPENAPIYSDMTVLDYLRFVSRIRRIPKAERAARTARMAEVCQLGKVLQRPVGELSKGFRQRVGLAQALIHDPDYLVLDEPTAGLDPNQIAEVREVIRTIGRTRTIILSTHILGEVIAMCDRVLIIDRGRLIAEGDPKRPEYMLDPQTAARFKRVAGKVSGAGVEQVQTALDAAPFARDARVTADPSGDGRVEVEFSPGDADDPAEAFFRLAVEKGWTLAELRAHGASLEDAFRALTTGDHAQTPPASPTEPPPTAQPPSSGETEPGAVVHAEPEPEPGTQPTTERA